MSTGAVQHVVVNTGGKDRLVRHGTTLVSVKRNLALCRLGRRGLAATIAALVVVLLDLGPEASPIWRSTNARQHRADGLDKLVFHLRRRVLQSRLDNVIAK